ncbi:MAG TPA: DUF2845 domain-containing protein [Nevskiaceae bacterium]|nr:DUF2845 domain-containing protein [Nevskiaceae bacterium]
MARGLGLVLLALSGAATAQDSLRCGNRLVSIEARMAEVLAACGEPSLRDVWSHPAPRSGNEIAEIEEWTYNFGPNQLLRLLRFRHGRLRRIDADGYGFASSHPPACRGERLLPGLSKYRLLASCGEPLTRSRSSGYRPLRSRPRGYGERLPREEYLSEVQREEWVYNFGSHQLLKIVHIENGRIVNVETGDRGFDPP